MRYETFVSTILCYIKILKKKYEINIKQHRYENGLHFFCFALYYIATVAFAIAIAPAVVVFVFTLDAHTSSIQ